MAADDDRVVLIILRAWREPGAPAPLRVRIVATPDLERHADDRTTTVVADVEAACAVVRALLTDLAG